MRREATVVRVFGQAILIAGCLSGGGVAQAREVVVPVRVKAVVSGKHITWVAPRDSLLHIVPQLNIGDSVTVIAVTDEVTQLGKLKQAYRRFAGRSCHTSWFRKKCTDTFAHDTSIARSEFHVTGQAGTRVKVTLEFGNSQRPDLVFKPGEFSLDQYVGVPIDIPGPLELVSIVAAVETDIPDRIPGRDDPEGPVVPFDVVGLNAPAPWFKLVIDFKTAAENQGGN